MLNKSAVLWGITRRRVTPQKTTDFINIAAEDWNQGNAKYHSYEDPTSCTFCYDCRSQFDTGREAERRLKSHRFWAQNGHKYNCTPLEGLHLKRLRHANETQQHSDNATPGVWCVSWRRISLGLYNSEDILYLMDSCQLQYGRMDLTSSGLTMNNRVSPLKGDRAHTSRWSYGYSWKTSTSHPGLHLHPDFQNWFHGTQGTSLSSKTSRPDQGPTQNPMGNWRGYSGRGVKLTTYLNIMTQVQIAVYLSIRK
jgi:hypothetical protein